MVELLVSVVIMSVGVLGMAGLQIISIQQNRSALLQGDATLRANDILDRIRANPDSAYAADLTDAPAATTNCIGSACNEAEMAAFDIVQWKCSIKSVDAAGDTYPVCASFGIAGTMPGPPCVAAGDVCAGGSVALNGEIYEVTVQWVDQEQSGGSGGANRSVTVRMKAP